MKIGSVLSLDLKEFNFHAEFDLHSETEGPNSAWIGDLQFKSGSIRFVQVSTESGSELGLLECKLGWA